MFEFEELAIYVYILKIFSVHLIDKLNNLINILYLYNKLR